MKKIFFCTLLLFTLVFSLILGKNVVKKSVDEKYEKIDSLIMSSFSPDEPGVSVLVSIDGIPFYVTGIGLSDVKSKKKITPSCTFAVGSLSKQITAMAVMILIDRGEIALNDKLSSYLELNQSFELVKISHLLTHTSGIKDLFEISEWRWDLSKKLSKQKVLDMIKNETPEFEPGTATDYSNSGYYLLGLLIEKVSGVSLNEFIRNNILKPLQMKNTGFLDEFNLPSTTGYEKRNNEFVKPFDVDLDRFFAGGQIITNVHDLLKWDNSLYLDKLVSSEILKQYFSPFILNDGRSSHNACGWQITNFNGVELYGHGGGINGYICQTYRIPTKRIYIAILSNSIDRDRKVSIASIAQKIVEIMLDGINNPLKTISVNGESLRKFSGLYQLPNNAIREVIFENSKLFYVVNSTTRSELKPIEEDTFHVGKGTIVEFIKDSDEKIISMILNNGIGKSIKLIKIK